MTDLRYPPYIQNNGTIIRHYYCADIAERDGLSPPPGSTAFVEADDTVYLRDTANAWVAQGGTGPGGEHPDLATHVALGLDEEHTHPYSSDSHNHDASYSATGHSHGGGSEAFPVGAVFIAVVSTDPATLLGYGTWSAFGAGRVLVGRDSGDVDFDTAEETGGAKTVTLTEAQMPAHVHAQQRFPTATGALIGFTVDTSMSGTPAAANNTGSTGSGSAHSNVQPYIVVYMWKRTA
jgi:hypothetical protein